MAETAISNQNQYSLVSLVDELDARKGVLDESTVRQLLIQATLDWPEVAPYVEPRTDTYARHWVVRRENYEVLVLTWSPSQGSVAHDHAGSLCGLKVVKGMTELKELGLSGTKITDAGLKDLAGLKQLETLYLNQTKTTEAGVAELKKALPKCTISR